MAGPEIPKDEISGLFERKEIAALRNLGGVSGIAKKLGTSLQTGLATHQVPIQQAKYGSNTLPEGEKVTLLGLIMDAFKDTMMLLLVGAATLSIVLGMTVPDPETGVVDYATGWIEGTAILVSVSVVVMVTAVNDYRKAKKFEEMNAVQSKKEIEVIRGGHKTSIDISELVVGDLVLVGGGQTLSADGIYIEGQDLKVDESACTGESDIMKKNLDKDPFFLSGTNITEGEGRMLCLAIGTFSFAGKLAMSTRGAPSETPLQVKLAHLAELIGKMGMLGAILTFTILSLKHLYKIQQGTAVFAPADFIDFLLVAITMVVVAIPEGLPLAVTIALAYSMKSMLSDNCLVRILAACETMGGSNAICSDKTGTLTTNKMTVVQGHIAEDNFVFDGYGVLGGTNATELDSHAESVRLPNKPEVVDLLCEGLSFNSNAEEQMIDGALVWCGGNKTEYGLLGFVKRVGRDYQRIRESVQRNNKRTYPFSSAKKRMTTIIKRTGKFYIHVKGASELVLADCTHYVNRSGEHVLFESSGKDRVMKTILQMADQGNRTIGVAISIEPENSEFPVEEPQPNLTLIGIMGLQDPIRQAVPGAIKDCARAGIVVRMVTGDNMNTAIAIAKKCGLIDDNDIKKEGTAMEGKTFRAMAAQNPEKLLHLLPNLRVLARSSPTDKLVLVSCLMDQGDIIAVTGDGTNDAPALKLADVGFAMHTGTEVATGASDMVLMDDNFASVVKAIVWGRTVNDNIRKFLQFQLTVNFAGVLLTLIGSTFSDEGEEPLKPVQMLWLNLIMDTLAALALATEKPSRECLDRLPFFRAAPLLSKRMIAFVLGHGMFQLIVMLLILNFGHNLFSVGPCDEKHGHAVHTTEGNCAGNLKHSTYIFNIFIWMQLFNEFNARKLYGEVNIFSGLQRSPAFFMIMLLCIAFQFLAVQYMGKFMHTTPLTFNEWLICIAIAVLEIPVGLIINLLPIPAWQPTSTTDNTQGLDAKKRTAIYNAKVSAGMIKDNSAEKVSSPHAKNRWSAAGKKIQVQARVVKEIREQKKYRRDVAHSIWGQPSLAYGLLNA